MLPVAHIAIMYQEDTETGGSGQGTTRKKE